MKKNIFIILFILTFFNMFSCKEKLEGNIIQKNAEPILHILTDSIRLFDKVEEFNIERKSFENDSIRIAYFSITQKDFFDAINKNSGHIKFFSRNYKLNEDIRQRSNSMLKVESNEKLVYLKDMVEQEDNRSEKYFIQGKIDNLLMLKKIDFEDEETLFYHSENLNLKKRLWGITSCYSPKEPIIFYTHNFFIMPSDSTHLCIFRVNNDRVNALLNIQTKWFTNFSFFDNEESAIYYIHSFYDENFRIKSTYAKMEYFVK